MVTKRVIRISPPRKEAVARKPAQEDKKTSSSSVAVVDSFNNNDDDDDTVTTKTKSKQKSTVPLYCNHPSCIRRAQHPSPLCWMHCAQARDVTCRFSGGCNNKGILLGLCPDHGGLVQLCRWRGCINEANLEKRGGLCWMHQAKGGHDYDDDSSSSEEEEEGIRLCRFRGCISCATADDGLCDMHTPNHGSSGISKKRVYALEHSSYNDAEKRQRTAFVIDLTNVPPQPPIPKSVNRIKEGASKYTGVCFHKKMNKWQAQIFVDGKQRSIGYYDEEEEAAVDYARALFKYKGQAAIDRSGRQNKFIIELKDVHPQPLILKNGLSHSKEYRDNTRRRNVNKGSSKYTGVYFEKGMKKWKAQIMIEGRVRSIGYYETEEEAAADYARAAFKYKPKRGYATYGRLDLKDVPDQPLIRSDTNKSGFKGVKKNKRRWEARLNGKNLGTFDTKEEAAGIYARARYYVEKEGELSKEKEQREAATVPEESIEVVAV